jgi:hypothetical protein
MRALRGRAGTSQHDELVNWRYDYLIWAGLDSGLAELVAGDQRWDLHALLELAERGCPPVLAARILAPIDDEEGARA